MSSVQTEIFEKICSLSNSVDVSQVVIPNCPFVKDAWDDNDLTILNLFNIALQLECDLKTQIDEVASQLDRNNPIISGLNLCCCSVDCNTNTAEIRLSDALTTIIECVCAAKAKAEEALETANSANASIGSLQSQITSLQTNVTSLLATRVDTLLRLACIETRLDNASIPGC